MPRELPRWVLVVVLLACVVALVVWARGTEHHRGIFEGALGAGDALAQGPTG
ncbi:hypothetical protein [Nocardioides sp. P5_E3]